MVTTPTAPARKRTRLAPEARRAQILEIGLEVFSESGYGASMGDIGKRAGVTRTVLYHYFATKEELFIAVADRLQTELLRKLAPVLSSPDDLEARTRAGVQAFLAFSEEWPDSWNILLPRGDAPDPEVMAMRKQVEQQLLTTLASVISSDLAEVGIDLESTQGQVMARALMGGVVHVMSWWRDHPEVEVEQIIEPLFAITWRGAGGVANQPASVTKTRRKR